MGFKNLLLFPLFGLSFLLPANLKAQSYDSLKTVEVARNLENFGFNLDGYIINKPFEAQIDYNDSSVVIDCPLVAEKKNNDTLMSFPLFIAFNKNDSTNRFYRDFVNRYSGLGFILDDNTISPQIYSDSLKKLLKKTNTSIKRNNPCRLENRLCNVYPNPSNGLINIKYKIKNNSNISLNLYNLLGEQIREFSEDAFPGEHIRKINVSNLSSGIYFLRIAIDSDKKRFVDAKKINIIK